MKKRLGFTLVELLAVIVILAIILAIAIPSITGIVDNAKKQAFEDDAKMLLRSVSYKIAQDGSFDVSTLEKTGSTDTIKSELGLDTSNYGTVSIEMQGNKPYINVVGSNKWSGLKAMGTQLSITVVDLSDGTKPVITLLGSSPVTINLGSSYTDAGATASDDVDGNITANIVTSNTVNTNVVGTYTVTYSVSDAAGNIATQVVRTVKVTDPTPPVITMLGVSPITINIGDTYSDAGATASDNIDGDITANITITSTVNINVPGSYTVTYNVHDAAGNNATSAVRTVNVTDTVPPVITMLGSSPVTLSLGAGYSDAGATASDNIDGNITANISVVSTVNINAYGSYTVTYNVSDAAGNHATTVVRTVNVSPTYYDLTKGVNKPQLATGMTPIKWDGSTWVDTTTNDSAWYNYDSTNKQWANARTADGSMWVWIPRFAYQIATNYHTATVGTINIKFLIDKTNTTMDSTSIATTPTYAGSNQTNYIKEPAFTFGSSEIIGFWVSKFEISGTSSAPTSKPNLASQTSNSGSMFNYARSMESKSMFGWGTTGNGIDTHIPKNTEWGAVAYLAQSTYGKNSELYVNNSTTYITGCSGGSVNPSNYSGCQYTYDTTQGQGASTTGTIYGIYDMSGGRKDLVMGNFNNNAGSGMLPTDADPKYSNVYTAYSSSYYGDAMYEVSNTTGGSYSWNSDFAYFPDASGPWITRGATYGNRTDAGIFSYYGTSGGYDLSAFHTVLMVETGF